MKREIIVGTRDSKLAMWQAQWVVAQLRKHYPEKEFIIKGMKTKGDHLLDAALAKLGDKGLFTKELELAMLKGEVDMAVHSMKDLPTDLPEGLTIGAICQRENPGDVLISKTGLFLDDLPIGAKIGTSSLRRSAQLLHYRPDFQMEVMRGNVITRLRKLDETDIDATILAYAGIHRLDLAQRVTQVLPFSICLPAVGQGAIGIEVVESNQEIVSLIAVLDDFFSRTAITAERAFMRKLEGGCQVPIGAYALVKENLVCLEGVVAGLDGKQLLRLSQEGTVNNPAEVGVKLGEEMLRQGADEILNTVRREFDNNG